MRARPDFVLKQAAVPHCSNTSQRWWEGTNPYGRARAEVLGIREKDMDGVIQQYRQRKHAREKRE